jgi:hypothetical protein
MPPSSHLLQPLYYIAVYGYILTYLLVTSALAVCGVLESEKFDLSFTLYGVSKAQPDQTQTHVIRSLLTSEIIQILGLLSDLRSQTGSMVPPLLVVVLGVPQFTLNLLIPLLLLQEPQPSLVFLGGPFRKADLRFTLGSSGFFL